MVTLDDVAAMIDSLPEVHTGERHGAPTWLVGKKAFAWERPFSKADIKRFGAETAQGSSPSPTSTGTRRC